MALQQPIYTMTITPGFADWEEPVAHYIQRKNYGYNMTTYTFDNKISALLVKSRLENEGYIIHLEEPCGNTSTTVHQKIVSGITL